jgi:LAO/AO transport system kinase
VSGVAALADRSRDGDRRALARLLTLVEDGSARQRRDVVAALADAGGHARLIGITGPPGAGKSTVTSALVTELRRAGRRVAVLAVDPSSPLTGGALLGDRIRLQEHHDDPGVYVRSIAARGQLGGLAAVIPVAVLVCEATGVDDVIVETVGVGQSEVDVASVADTTVLVLAPGLGDSIQAAKAGVLEIADVLVVNKADQPGVGKLESELHGMLELGRLTHGGPALDVPGWEPPVLRTVGVRGEGVAALLEAIDRHGRSVAISDGAGPAQQRARRWIVELAAARVRSAAHAPEGAERHLLDRLATEVAGRRLDPMGAAEELLRALTRDGDPAAAPETD